MLLGKLVAGVWIPCESTTHALKRMEERKLDMMQSSAHFRN